MRTGVRQIVPSILIHESTLCVCVFSGREDHVSHKEKHRHHSSSSLSSSSTSRSRSRSPKERHRKRKHRSRSPSESSDSSSSSRSSSRGDTCLHVSLVQVPRSFYDSSCKFLVVCRLTHIKVMYESLASHALCSEEGFGHTATIKLSPWQKLDMTNQLFIDPSVVME